MAVDLVKDPVHQAVAVLRPDAVVAQELRDEIAPHLDAICRVYDKARAAGLHMGFDIAPDSFGKKFRVTEIKVFKPL
jgi:hypothetical protein